MTNRKSSPGRKRGLALMSAAFLFLALCYFQPTAPSASAQGVSNSILEVIPSSPLSTLAAGTQGTFYAEMPVYLNRTVNATSCSITATQQQSFFSGGNQVGTLRIWGTRTGNSTGNASNTSAASQATNLTNTGIAVVNISLDLPSFNGTVEMQGTLGRTRLNFENLLTATGGFGPGTGTAGATGLPVQDVVAITGGTGAFSGATGEATLSPILTQTTNSTTGQITNVNCSTGAFRIVLSQLRRPSTFSIPERF
ncbi:MAG: hypothetical protein ACJ74J_06070 [Blastocatellia bacterium]